MNNQYTAEPFQPVEQVTLQHYWQLCPKCAGTGTMMQMLPGYVVSTHAICDLCNGKKIISSLTGQPPQ